MFEIRDNPVSQRIVTLTLNPALDLAMEAPRVLPGHKLRARDERFDAGGGGINVARVIHELGGDTLAVLATGGSTGRIVEELLVAEGVTCLSVDVPGTTRISVTVHETSSGAEYRFVPEGPVLTPSDTERLLEELRHVNGAWLVASGSLPRGVPQDFYARLARDPRRPARLALDTSGAALASALYEGVDLIKMSLSEFQSVAPCKSPSPDALGEEACRLAARGAAATIALTLGQDGAIFATPERHVHFPAARVRVTSTVGAGDSFLAGLVLGLARGQPAEDALKLAIATSAASVIGRGTARVRRSDVEALLAGRFTDEFPLARPGDAERDLPGAAARPSGTADISRKRESPPE